MRSAIACLTLWMLLPIPGMAAAQLPRDPAPVEPDATLTAAEAAVAARPHDVQPRIDLSKLWKTPA